MKFIEKFLTHFPLYIVAFFISCITVWSVITIFNNHGLNPESGIVMLVLLIFGLYLVRGIVKLINKIENGHKH